MADELLLSDEAIRDIWKRIYDPYVKAWDEIYGQKEAGRDIAKAQRDKIADKIEVDMPSITRYQALQYIRDLWQTLKER